MQYKWFFNKYSQYEILDQTEDWLYCKKKANLQVNFEKNFWYAYLNKNKAQYELTPEVFQSCPFLHKIFKNYTVKYIILGGSGLYNITDNLSDYDLNIFIKEPVEEKWKEVHPCTTTPSVRSIVNTCYLALLTRLWEVI